jgi:hypothetical protein
LRGCLSQNKTKLFIQVAMKKIYLTASLLLLATLCFAQITKKDSLKSKLDSLFLKVKLNTAAGPSSTNYAPNFSPLTPNAASFQKHGDYQVNLATGVPDISIPLYTIEEGILKNPISLKYHAGGHKINEFAPWVGWGFNLDFGPSMNRSIIGMADDKNSTGSYLYNPIINRDLCSSSSDATFCSVVNAGNADLEPDLFTYSTHSSGGKFMLRHNGQKPFQMPWQAVDISPEYTAPNNPISGFQVVNPDGTNCHFGITAGGYGGTEYQKTLTSSGTYTDNGISTWQIGQITSLNSANKISFQYQTGGKV